MDELYMSKSQLYNCQICYFHVKHKSFIIYVLIFCTN